MQIYIVKFYDKAGNALPQYTRKIEGLSHWDVCLHVLKRVLRRLKGAVDYNVLDA
ncbi:hypothetical protein IWQ48_004221 [Labrenzia sp. EL_13]|nr:hypothetical protein [Labrenzia sp. EL_13]